MYSEVYMEASEANLSDSDQWNLYLLSSRHEISRELAEVVGAKFIWLKIARSLRNRS